MIAPNTPTQNTDGTTKTTEKSRVFPAVLIGITLSLIYIVILLMVGTGFIPLPCAIATFDEPLKVNEWGDFFAGLLSPLALGWFIGTLMLQRKELSQTREEMAEARKVWNEQKLQQEKLAIATEEANELQSKALFFAQYSHLNNAIEDASRRLIDHIDKMPPTTSFNSLSKVSIAKLNAGNAEAASTELLSILNKFDGHPEKEQALNHIRNNSDYVRFAEAYKLLSTQASTLGLTPVIRAHQRDCAQILGL